MTATRSNRVRALWLALGLVVGCATRGERPRPIVSDAPTLEPHDLLGDAPLEDDEERRRGAVVALLTRWVDQLFLLELGELGAQAEPQVALRARLVEEAVEPALETAVWHRQAGGFTCRAASAHVHVQVDAAGPRARIARLAPRPDRAAIALRVRLTGVDGEPARREIERAIRDQLGARGYRVAPPARQAGGSDASADLADFARSCDAAHALGVDVAAHPSPGGQRLKLTCAVEGASLLAGLDRLRATLDSVWSRDEGGPAGGVGPGASADGSTWLQRFPPGRRAASSRLLDAHAADVGHSLADWLVFRLRTLWPADADASSTTSMAERQALQLAAALPGTADPDARARLVASIGELGSAAAPALPALVRALTEDPDHGVRVVTARTLGKLALAEHGVVAALTLTLRAEEADLQVAASEALGRLGPASGPAVPALIANLGAPLRVARAAAGALGRVGPGASEAVRPLAELLWRPSAHLVRDAADALAGIGPAAAEAVPALLAVLTADGDRNHRVAAMAALGAIGPAAAPSAPALIERLRDGDAYERRVAARALGTIGAPELAVPALLDVLTPASTDLGREAADALGNVGPAAGDAAARALLDLLLADPRAPRAYTALLKLGPTSVRLLIPELAGLHSGHRLGEERLDVRVRLLIAHGAEAVPGLLGELGAGRALPLVRFVFARMGETALPALTAAARGDDPRARLDALSALGAVGGPGATALLLATFQHPDAATRAAAATALGSVWPLAPSAVAELEALRDADPAPEVRAAAAATLRRLASRQRP